MFKSLIKVVYWAAYSFAAVMVLFAALLVSGYLASGPGNVNTMDNRVLATLAVLAAGAAWTTGRALKRFYLWSRDASLPPLPKEEGITATEAIVLFFTMR